MDGASCQPSRPEARASEGDTSCQASSAWRPQRECSPSWVHPAARRGVQAARHACERGAQGWACGGMGRAACTPHVVIPPQRQPSRRRLMRCLVRRRWPASRPSSPHGAGGSGRQAPHQRGAPVVSVVQAQAGGAAAGGGAQEAARAVAVRDGSQQEGAGPGACSGSRAAVQRRRRWAGDSSAKAAPLAATAQRHPRYHPAPQQASRRAPGTRVQAALASRQSPLSCTSSLAQWRAAAATWEAQAWRCRARRVTASPGAGGRPLRVCTCQRCAWAPISTQPQASRRARCSTDETAARPAPQPQGLAVA